MNFNLTLILLFEPAPLKALFPVRPRKLPIPLEHLTFDPGSPVQLKLTVAIIRDRSKPASPRPLLSEQRVRIILNLPNSSHARPATPYRGSPASIPSPRNSDTRLKTRRAFFESHPSPAYKTANAEASGYRASSCIRDIRIRLERCRIHGLLVTNLKRR
jgi:hypothetical protein